MAYDFDQAEALINGVTAVFTESAMTVMTPPNPTNLATLRDRGAKMMVFHGTADPVLLPNGVQAYGVDTPHYLGPTIVASKNRPVRILFRNQDLAALAGCAELAPALRRSWGADRFAKLQAAVDRLDFRAALDLLDRFEAEPAPEEAAR